VGYWFVYTSFVPFQPAGEIVAKIHIAAIQLVITRFRAMKSTGMAVVGSTQLSFLSSLPARVGALPLGGLAILEACCFVGAAGGVAGAVRVSAGAR
jgi:hypothetical protein